MLQAKKKKKNALNPTSLTTLIVASAGRVAGRPLTMRGR